MVMSNYDPLTELKLIYDRLKKDKERIEEELFDTENLILKYEKAIVKLEGESE